MPVRVIQGGGGSRRPPPVVFAFSVAVVPEGDLCRAKLRSGPSLLNGSVSFAWWRGECRHDAPPLSALAFWPIVGGPRTRVPPRLPRTSPSDNPFPNTSQPNLDQFGTCSALSKTGRPDMRGAWPDMQSRESATERLLPAFLLLFFFLLFFIIFVFVFFFS